MTASESNSERGLASLAGRTVLVTGAGKLFGRAIALALGRASANVAVHVGRSLEEGQAVVNELLALGVDAEVFAANQREVVEVEACCDAALERFGTIDGLVNSAAIWPQGDLETLTQEDFDQAVEVNLRGPFFFARKLGLAMRERGGAIVNIADVSTDRPWVDSLPYCA
ncbi:MAG: SDR family NAD(P)-dependent oxidoreductase, partial [Planctomycetota bacterium]